MSTKTSPKYDHSFQKIVFLRAQDPKGKLLLLGQICYLHFERNEDLLLITSDEKMKQSVDDLLWRFSPTAFIPHMTDKSATNEKICITATKANITHATYIFNLTLEALIFPEPCRVIYEFEDNSNPSRQKLSQEKFKLYKEKKFLIELR